VVQKIESNTFVKLGHWSFLAIIFIFLGVDENVSLHERVGVVVRSQHDFSGVFYYSWLVPYILILLVIGILYIPFLLRLPRNVLYHFIVAFSVFTSGAIGMEMLGGRHEEAFGKDLMLVFYYSVEEFLEMLGVVIFIKGILNFIVLSKAKGTLKISIVD